MSFQPTYIWRRLSCRSGTEALSSVLPRSLCPQVECLHVIRRLTSQIQSLSARVNNVEKGAHSWHEEAFPYPFYHLDYRFFNSTYTSGLRSKRPSRKRLSLIRIVHLKLFDGYMLLKGIYVACFTSRLCHLLYINDADDVQSVKRQIWK